MCCLNVLPMFCPSVLPSVLPIVVHSGIEDGEATMVGSPTEGSPGLPGGDEHACTTTARRVRSWWWAEGSSLQRPRHDDDAATTTTTTTRRRRRVPSQSPQPQMPSQSMQPSRPQSLQAHGPCSLPGPHSRCSPQAVAAALTEAQNLSASQVPSRCSSPGLTLTRASP